MSNLLIQATVCKSRLACQSKQQKQDICTTNINKPEISTNPNAIQVAPSTAVVAPPDGRCMAVQGCGRCKSKSKTFKKHTLHHVEQSVQVIASSPPCARMIQNDDQVWSSGLLGAFSMHISSILSFLRWGCLTGRWRLHSNSLLNIEMHALMLPVYLIDHACIKWNWYMNMLLYICLHNLLRASYILWVDVLVRTKRFRHPIYPTMSPVFAAATATPIPHAQTICPALLATACCKATTCDQYSSANELEKACKEMSGPTAMLGQGHQTLNSIQTSLNHKMPTSTQLAVECHRWSGRHHQGNSLRHVGSNMIKHYHMFRVL